MINCPIYPEIFFIKTQILLLITKTFQILFFAKFTKINHNNENTILSSVKRKCNLQSQEKKFQLWRDISLIFVKIFWVCVEIVKK